MENFRKLNFGPKVYDKLILMYPQLSSLMFSANINSNMCTQNANRDRLATSMSSESKKRQVCEKHVINTYISSKFVKNKENGSNKITMDVNFYKYKNKNGNQV